jgi:hypothetical protein
MTEDLVPLEEELRNPADLKRLKQASEVLKLHVVDGLTIAKSCEQVGISRATYSRWVKDGIFAPLISAYIGPIQLEMQNTAMKGMQTAVSWLVDVIEDNVKDATNFDKMAAIRFLWSEFVGPWFQAGAPIPAEVPEEEEDAAADYLKEEPAWLGPGETVTEVKTTTRSDQPIKVGPES